MVLRQRNMCEEGALYGSFRDIFCVHVSAVKSFFFVSSMATPRESKLEKIQ